MRPPLDDRSHGFNEPVAGASCSKGRKKDAEIVVVEVELGAAVGVCGVDPLAAAEEPVAGVAAMFDHHRGQGQVTDAT